MPNDPCRYGLPETTIALICDVFRRHPLVKQVILYGSRAKGTYKKGSDIDLTIKGDAVSLSELFQIENELDDLLLPYKIDLSLMHKLGNPSLIEHVERVGQIFYSAGTESLTSY